MTTHKNDTNPFPLDLDQALDRISDLEQVNVALKSEIAQLRRAIADQQSQFESRVQEDNWSLQQEVARWRGLSDGLIERIHQDRLVRDRLIKKRPLWLRSEPKLDSALAFVLSPYGPGWFAEVFATISQVFKENGCRCQTALQMTGRIVVEDIWQGISAARLIVADLTGNNPNVAYEVGIADHLGKDIILLNQTLDPREIAFDFRGNRLLSYEVGNLGKLKAELGQRVTEILARKGDD